MRSFLALLVLFAVLVPATGADARRKPSKSEKRAIAEVFNAPPKCAKVFVSTVDERWATYEFNGDRIDVSPCEQVAADGVAILKEKARAVARRDGRQRLRVPGPRRAAGQVVKDLHVRCFDTP